MLRQLTIENVAIIERLDLSFEAGLTCLTGETGAGKSILIGALNLVLGARAEREWLRAGAAEAKVTALFDLPPDTALLARLDELQIPREEGLLLKRTLSADGRSKASVNDQSVTIGSLAAIGARLLDISSQNEQQSLTQRENHLALLDQMAAHETLLVRMRRDFEVLQAARNELRALLRAGSERAEREEFLRFQLSEIERAQVRPGEEVALKAEREEVAHAAKLDEAFRGALGLLTGNEGALGQLARAKRELARVLPHWSHGAALVARLDSCTVELDDLSAALGASQARLPSDPARLDAIEERLALLNRLLRKHGPSSGELLAKAAAMQEELGRLARLESAQEELESKVRGAEETAKKTAARLSSERTQKAQSFAAAIEGEMNGLGLRGAKLHIALGPKSNPEGAVACQGGTLLGPLGADEAEFFWEPNAGEGQKALSRIASGGELSRVMLAIKSTLMARADVPVTVFDEVDAGIGGAVAQEVGQKIKALAGARQVLCITHLPQIAAYADHHLLVVKSSGKGRTQTQVLPLANENERRLELARMMSGTSGNETLNDAAGELLRYAREKTQSVPAPKGGKRAAR